MGPPGITGTQGETAKHMFDRIGKQVYETVKNEAENYISELEGKLSQATLLGERVSSLKTCQLVEDYRSKANGDVKRYPCANRSPVRFSDESRSQCTYNRIKDNETDDNACGACAPYRRLHLCDYNLEKMGKTSTTKHDLLAEVCMAAKYEGDSIKTHYTIHKHTNNDSAAELCTELARSFADIGDIIRGKDLYLGDIKKKQNGKKTEREKLEENLKRIFGKIHEDVTNGKKEVLKTRYKDINDPEFFKLREDWWTANRATVWKAITCHAGESDKYFRNTCNDSEHSGTFSQPNKYCRCNGDKPGEDKANVDPPTYFDYVPQYLRWFEEWAEDFCRIRKHKLKNAKEQCREKYKSGTDRYCSRNGYDCTQTIRGRNILVSDSECTNCSVVCTPFVKWIENKKLEFEKQKGKYTKEIEKANGTSNGTTIRTQYGTINNMYRKDFYQQLQSGYGDVNAFLELLNKETTCKDHPKVEEKSDIDFNEGTEKTFSHTEYCETCPWCATKKKGIDGNWEEQKYEEGCENYLMKPIDESKSTDIDLLVKDTSGTTMVEKLGGLCNDSSKRTVQMENWQCHYEKKSQYEDGFDKDYCVLKDDKKKKPEHRTIKSYYTLFPNWINEMLKDSIDWSKELKTCINNEKPTNCIRECKSKCDCFKKWVVQKEQEWKQLEEHYEKENFSGDFGPRISPYVTLEGNLQYSYLEMIRKYYAQEKPVQEIEQIIEKNKNNFEVKEDDNSITKFLQQEKGIATKCIEKQEECKQQKKQQRQKQPADKVVSRSGASPDTASPDTKATEEKEEEEEEEEEEDLGEESEEPEDQAVVDQDGQGETTEKKVPATTEEGSPKETTTPEKSVDVCKTVAELFSNVDNLKEACTQKYGGNNSRLGWKCIPTSGGEKATGGSGESTGSDATTGGSICVPPRRRRLYVTPLTKWATNMEATEAQAGGDEATEASVPLGDGVSKNPKEALLKAFVESAAVETFFLWHRYKKIKDKEKKEKEERERENAGLDPFGGSVDDEASTPDPQTQLQSGTIPPDFLRQMFYTLGDYRDICIGGDRDIVGDTIVSNKEGGTPTKISDKIKEILEKVDKKQPDKQNSGTTPKTWWEENGPHIWNAMVCALTYKDNGDKGKPQVDDTVHSQLWDTTKNKPKNRQYEYDQVKLDENSGTGPKSNDPINNPTLKEFISRPPYFRYLEEWGETFCRQRARMLKQVEKNCTQHGKKQYSGDGEYCDKIHKDPTTLPDLGYSCPKSCSSYRKWIERKKTQYEKQEKAYNNQKANVQNNNDNGFCGTLEREAAAFLNSLKNGPCKKENGKDNDEYEIKFDDKEKTFKHAKYCDPCPKFKVDCKNGKCDNDKGGDCNGIKTIDAKNFETMVKPTEEIVMRVSDNSGNKFNDLSDCQNAGIFEGIKENKYKCGNVCGYVVCKSENGNGEKVNGIENQNKIITIRGLVAHWVQYFLEDYNKIKHKISHCINNGEVSKCIKDCVKKWVEEKEKEWKKLKEHYQKQYGYNNSGESYPVRSILEQFQSGTEFKNAIKPCGTLQQFESFCGLNGDESSKKENGNEDAVQCLLKNLGNEAKKCEEKQQTSGIPEAPCVNHTPLEDDDEEPYEDLLLQETEEKPEEAKKNMMPKICKDVVQEAETVVESGCVPAKTPEAPAASPAPKEPPAPSEGTKERPSPPEKKAPLPKEEKTKPKRSLTPTDDPWEPLKNAMLSSTIMWSIGIGFATFTYFYLKKKMKKRKKKIY
ncbi:hypothetical protein PFNF54_04075 [Plasmodium falciparum NF54]|uniref:Erythrocyte membrane protein 1 n=1 Tax=Plasmodium falciparum (isolate NF54) TaxID=5843 RepID=W7K2W6_PLAFO|nr:hypothetical protein PFNF54_04075 [Plasmodium falciparum NF54]